MSLVFMSLSIGSKRLAEAVIPPGTVINDIILWKYFLKKKTLPLTVLRNHPVGMTK